MGSQGIAPARQEAGAVLASLRRLFRFLRLAGRQSESAHGLSAAQLFVLQSLAGHPASSLAELAERTLTDQSSVSIVVEKLADRGLVLRRRASSDRRRTEIALSARGQSMAAKGADLAQVRIVNAVTRMSPARRQALVASLEGLVGDIGADVLAPRMFEAEPAKPPRKPRTRKQE